VTWIVLAVALLFCRPERVLGNTPAQWQADLQVLVSTLESTHPNLFFQVSAADFNAAVSQLNQSIPQLSDTQVMVGMLKLVAMVGDPHTEVYPPFTDLPIQFRWFSDGLFVTAVSADYSQALGAKVIQVGNMTTDQAYAAVGTVISHHNDPWLREMSVLGLAAADLLYVLGVTDGPGSVGYVFQDLSGAQFTLQVAPSSADLIGPLEGDVPLWLTNSSLNYWYEYLPTT
jgi:hypothetical protein